MTQDMKQLIHEYNEARKIVYQARHDLEVAVIENPQRAFDIGILKLDLSDLDRKLHSAQQRGF